jgi:PAS domain S-box-containing protein
VILLDVRMPDMDGFETAELIRKRQRSRDTPIIFITAAHASPDQIVRGYSVGAVDYIFKPFMPEVLKAKVRIFLGLYKKTEELRESEVRFRTLVTNVPGAMYRREGVPPWDMLFLTDPIEKLSGYPASDFMERRRTYASIIHPEDVRALSEALGEAVRKATPYALEYRVLHAEGRVRWVFDRGQGVMGDLGTVRHVDGVLLEITDRKVAEEELRQRTAQLQAANKELEAFCYSVSHDLRAPLRGIDGFSKVVLRRYGENLDAKGRLLLERVCAGSQRMAELIDDLLNLSRLTRNEIRPEKVDLARLAREVAAELARTQPGRQVEFVIPDEIVAVGDARLLRVVLENLVGNAWKFTGRHGRARIEVGVKKQEGRTVYFVRDDGAGFDPACAHKLFGAFQRLHSAREFEGTGIGLATVQRIIRRHGGEAWAVGAVNHGATFYFTL